MVNTFHIPFTGRQPSNMGGRGPLLYPITTVTITIATTYKPAMCIYEANKVGQQVVGFIFIQQFNELNKNKGLYSKLKAAKYMVSVIFRYVNKKKGIIKISVKHKQIKTQNI